MITSGTHEIPNGYAIRACPQVSLGSQIPWPLGPAIHRLLQNPTQADCRVRHCQASRLPQAPNHLEHIEPCPVQGPCTAKVAKEPKTIWMIVAPTRTKRPIRPPSQGSVGCFTQPRNGSPNKGGNTAVGQASDPWVDTEGCNGLGFPGIDSQVIRPVPSVTGPVD